MPALPPSRPGVPRTGEYDGTDGTRRGCPRPDRPKPLPDPAAVELFLIPESAPPYDGDPPAAWQQSPTAGRDQDPARQAQAAPDARQAAPDARQADTGGRRAAGADEPPGWPSHFAQVLAETLAGTRPARQMVPWTTERARQHIERLGPQLMAGGQQPQVRRVVAFRPTDNVLEMSVVVGFGPRVRALAVRMERASSHLPRPGQPYRRGPRWVCTTIEAA